jgi:hypothetical protein
VGAGVDLGVPRGVIQARGSRWIGGTLPKSWPSPTYVVQHDFRAPLEYVYRWCTDYTPNDARLENDEFQRRVLRRSTREVVYEDLDDTKDGWMWARHTVRLLPPNHWRSTSVGSHREYRLDYRLTKLPGGRTRLTLTARRRPYGIGPKNPPRSQWERNVRQLWNSFGRSLEKDFRKTPAGKRRK